mgnify:CR=1 FL=1
METVVKALYNASFAIWNTLIGIAMTIFRTSPTAVSDGSPYGIVHSLYTSISAATIPIATCFFGDCSPGAAGTEIFDGWGQVLHHFVCGSKPLADIGIHHGIFRCDHCNAWRRCGIYAVHGRRP